jgi:hypothetical protein
LALAVHGALMGNLPRLCEAALIEIKQIGSTIKILATKFSSRSVSGAVTE